MIIEEPLAYGVGALAEACEPLGTSVEGKLADEGVGMGTENGASLEVELERMQIEEQETLRGLHPVFEAQSPASARSYLYGDENAKAHVNAHQHPHMDKMLREEQEQRERLLQRAQARKRLELKGKTVSQIAIQEEAGAAAAGSSGEASANGACARFFSFQCIRYSYDATYGCFISAEDLLCFINNTLARTSYAAYKDDHSAFGSKSAAESAFVFHKTLLSPVGLELPPTKCAISSEKLAILGFELGAGEDPKLGIPSKKRSKVGEQVAIAANLLGSGLGAADATQAHGVLEELNGPLNYLRPALGFGVAPLISSFYSVLPRAVGRKCLKSKQLRLGLQEIVRATGKCVRAAKPRKVCGAENSGKVRTHYSAAAWSAREADTGASDERSGLSLKGARGRGGLIQSFPNAVFLKWFREKFPELERDLRIGELESLAPAYFLWKNRKVFANSHTHARIDNSGALFTLNCVAVEQRKKFSLLAMTVAARAFAKLASEISVCYVASYVHAGANRAGAPSRAALWSELEGKNFVKREIEQEFFAYAQKELGEVRSWLASQSLIRSDWIALEGRN